MNFIEAVLAIDKVGLELCEDPNELSGIHHSICVYKETFEKDGQYIGGEFVGKLRWPDEDSKGNKLAASVDKELETEIKMRLKKLNL